MKIMDCVCKMPGSESNQMPFASMTKKSRVNSCLWLYVLLLCVFFRGGPQTAYLALGLTSCEFVAPTRSKDMKSMGAHFSQLKKEKI